MMPLGGLSAQHRALTNAGCGVLAGCSDTQCCLSRKIDIILLMREPCRGFESQGFHLCRRQYVTMPWRDSVSWFLCTYREYVPLLAPPRRLLNSARR